MNVRIALAGIAAAGLVVGVSACSTPSGKSWAITYEVSDQGGRPLPARYRERIRAEGPSVGGKVDAKVEAR